MVNVATIRMGSAHVYLHTARALEMAIKTLDQRLAPTSASRAQQRTIEQIVDASVPPEVAKIIRVAPALAVTQRRSTDDRARHLCNTSTSGTCASNFQRDRRDSDTSDTSASDGKVALAATHDRSLPVIGYVAPAPAWCYL